MSWYGDANPKETIRDGIMWADDLYGDDEQGRKEFAADIAAVCADVIDDLLGTDRRW